MPSMAMANMFFPARSQERGDTKRLSPASSERGCRNRGPLCWALGRVSSPDTLGLTKPLKGISHCLVLHHVNEASAQAEVGEDEENLLQDAVDVIEVLMGQQGEGWGSWHWPCREGMRSPEHPKAHLVHKELQHKGGHAAIDANEEVDAGQGHVGSAGDAEEEGGWVHQGGDGPSAGGRGRGWLRRTS